MISMLLLAAALSAGSQEFDETARQGAAEITLAKIASDAVAKPPAAGLLENAMQADSGRFATRAAAERECRALYAKAIAEAYQAQVKSVDARLGLTAETAEIATNVLEAALSAHFAKAFDAERKTACAAQAKTLAGAVKPSEADLESGAIEALRAEMCAKVAAQQKNPVFEENLAYISETIVEPVLEDGRKELKRQREYLGRTRCEAYAPSAVAHEIEANLAKNVAERKAKAKDPALAWGVFPGMLKEALPEVVAKRVLDRVVKRTDDVAVPVETEEVLKTIVADPVTHRHPSDSEQVFRGIFAAQVLDGALAKAQGEAPEKEREAFAAYVREHAAAPEIVKAVEARVKRELLPKWKAARLEAARRESVRLWPTLADSTWFPESEFADRTLARSDCAAAVKGWRQAPELAELATADGGRAVMDETAADADASVARAFELARTALAAQNAVLEEIEPKVLAEAKDRKSSFWSRTPDLAAIVGMLTEGVETGWAERRVRTLWGDGEKPANAEAQHATLFPSVKKRIELVARSILEQMEKPEPKPEEKPETPPEEKPEEPDPSDSPEKPEEPLMAYSIMVERDGETVKVKLMQGKTSVAERTPKAKIDEFNEAMKLISDKLGRDILRLP